MGAVDENAPDPTGVVSRIMRPHHEADGYAVSEDRERRPPLIAQVCERKITGGRPDELPLVVRHLEIGNRTPIAMPNGDDPDTHPRDTHGCLPASQGRLSHPGFDGDPQQRVIRKSSHELTPG